MIQDVGAGPLVREVAALLELLGVGSGRSRLVVQRGVKVRGGSQRRLLSCSTEFGPLRVQDFM